MDVVTLTLSRWVVIMETFPQSFIHTFLQETRKHVSSGISVASESSISELLETIEEMFPLYYMQIYFTGSCSRTQLSEAYSRTITYLVTLLNLHYLFLQVTIQ